MKLELGYFGGNMQSLEGKYKGIQVLITEEDCGDAPTKGQPYRIGFFKQDEDGEWEYDAFKILEFKCYNQERAIRQAKKAIDKMTLKQKSKTGASI